MIKLVNLLAKFMFLLIKYMCLRTDSCSLHNKRFALLQVHLRLHNVSYINRCTVVHCSAELNTFKHVLFDELISQKENTHNIFPAVSVNFTSSLIYCCIQCVTFLVSVVYKNSSIKLVISYLFPLCLLHCCFSTTLFSTVTHLRRLNTW